MKRKGFTLAEVLITLAIIGIVAALTIPTVVAKYNKHAQYTQFMKIYNTLQNAMQLASMEQGSPNTWDYTLSKEDFLAKYIEPYVKNQGYDTSYKTLDEPIKSLSGDVTMAAGTFMQNMSMPDYLVLNDGSIISLTYVGSNRADISIDINGKKGPNTIGRDEFSIRFGYDTENNKPSVGYFGMTDATLTQYCNPNGSSDANNFQGATCGARLLKEGAMNY